MYVWMLTRKNIFTYLHSYIYVDKSYLNLPVNFT